METSDALLLIVYYGARMYRIPCILQSLLLIVP